MIRGYRRRRGWSAWHAGVLARAQELPALHVLMDDEPPIEDAEAAAERRLANLRAWRRAIEARNSHMAAQAAPATRAEEPEP